MSELNTTAARELLTAALLINTEDDGHIQFDDSRYIDWSVPLPEEDSIDGAGRRFDVEDDDGDLARLSLTWAEIERLQRALTLTLLNRPNA